MRWSSTQGNGNSIYELGNVKKNNNEGMKKTENGKAAK
jgi:hypothetical protein